MTTAGESALAVAIQQLGKPYGWGAVGPGSFDCSGLMVYSYLNGPGIKIPRVVSDIWNDSTVTEVVDTAAVGQAAQAVLNGLPLPLLPGDMLIYMQPGAANNYQHVRMVVNDSTIIEAPGQNGFVRYQPIDLVGDPGEPYVGAKRVNGVGVPSAFAATTIGGSGTGGNQPATQNWTDYEAPAGGNATFLNSRPDPTDNLPFSSFFQSQNVPGGLMPIAGRTGGLKLPIAGLTDPLMPSTTLVRGGMVELVAQKFKFYFMINPQQIASIYGIDTSSIPPITDLAPDALQIGGYPISNNTVSFTLYFNRMYEVWQGNVTGPNGGPGPSALGVRWDIRALERLIGVFDATVQAGTTGLGTNGPGNVNAQTLPLQIVFGGIYSMQFQGIIVDLDYTYTLFSADMIPIEAFADVSVMRIYNPSQASPDLVTPGKSGSLVQTPGQMGTMYIPLSNATFNATTGLVQP